MLGTLTLFSLYSASLVFLHVNEFAIRMYLCKMVPYSTRQNCLQQRSLQETPQIKVAHDAFKLFTVVSTSEEVSTVNQHFRKHLRIVSSLTETQASCIHLLAFNMSTSFSISAAVSCLPTLEITNFKSNILCFTLKFCMIPASKD